MTAEECTENLDGIITPDGTCSVNGRTIGIINGEESVTFDQVTAEAPDFNMASFILGFSHHFPDSIRGSVRGGLAALVGGPEEMAVPPTDNEPVVDLSVVAVDCRPASEAERRLWDGLIPGEAEQWSDFAVATNGVSTSISALGDVAWGTGVGVPVKFALSVITTGFGALSVYATAGSALQTGEMSANYFRLGRRVHTARLTMALQVPGVFGVPVVGTTAGANQALNDANWVRFPFGCD
jgi:hypothetical protein